MNETQTETETMQHMLRKISIQRNINCKQFCINSPQPLQQGAYSCWKSYSQYCLPSYCIKKGTKFSQNEAENLFTMSSLHGSYLKFQKFLKHQSGIPLSISIYQHHLPSPTHRISLQKGAVVPFLQF